MQTLDRKDAARDANSRRFLNKCQARSLLLFNGCILNLATRVNPVELAWLRSDFGAIGILSRNIPRSRYPTQGCLSSRTPSCDAPGCIAHDGKLGGCNREHDAVATVLIIGASRGIGLEAVKVALGQGMPFVRWRGQPEEFASTTPSWKKWPATPSRWPR